MSREQFGNLQGRKLLEGRPGSKGNRYECDMCGKVYMSDEALQLHLLAHKLDAISAGLSDLIREVQNGIQVARI